MPGLIHSVATIGTSGQLGIGGTVPWVGDEAIFKIVSESATRVLAAAAGAVWVVGPNTVRAVQAAKAHLGIEANVAVYTDDFEPHDFLEMLRSRFGPDVDIWIMGGARTFEVFTPMVDTHHITVVPYDGPADCYLRPPIPGWGTEGETVCRDPKVS